VIQSDQGSVVVEADCRCGDLSVKSRRAASGMIVRYCRNSFKAQARRDPALSVPLGDCFRDANPL
jgi:hypothetical protein